MTRALTTTAAVGFVTAIICFVLAGMLGGVPWDGMAGPWVWGPPWAHGWSPGEWRGGGFRVVSRDFAWSGGQSLRIEVPADVEYTQGPATRLTISGPKALLDRVVVDNGDIGFGVDGWIGGAAPLKIVMTAPNVTDFEASGAQTLSIANYDQDALTIDISGAGRAVAKGQARRAALRISGSGDADMGGLADDDATVEISGAGRAVIAPKTSADVDISGMGQVTLLTHPATLNQRISGMGSIVQATAQ